MCGIIGFAGKSEAVPVLLDGLSRLEYRGYDSTGVAVVSSSGELQVKKSKGRLSVLRELLDTQKPLLGNIGIGHTRWATHGEPNDVNAHPHTGQEGKIAVVHNGIIENYLEIKNSLIRKGIVFSSDITILAKCNTVRICHHDIMNATFIKDLCRNNAIYLLIVIHQIVL